MTVIVRDLRPGGRADLEGFARVRHAALPYILFILESIVHVLTRTRPEARFRSLVAEEDGEVHGGLHGQRHRRRPDAGRRQGARVRGLRDGGAVCP